MKIRHFINDILDRAPRAFIQAKSAKRFDALSMFGVCHYSRKCIAAGSYPVHEGRGRPEKAQKMDLFKPRAPRIITTLIDYIHPVGHKNHNDSSFCLFTTPDSNFLVVKF